MNILGITGGLNRIDENRYSLKWMYHDSAAVLLRDGNIVAGIEEERLNRVKHTTCFPSSSIGFCLDRAELDIKDIDKVAYYFTEPFLNGFYLNHHIQYFPNLAPFTDIKSEIRSLFNKYFDFDPKDRLTFVNHHLAHAYSAYYHSNFENSLVLVIDGLGDNISTTLYAVIGGKFKILFSVGEKDSIGMFYQHLISVLGYNIFDEYKVMGLAPYGDPEKYKDLVRSLYKLLPNGKYEIYRNFIGFAVKDVIKQRKKGESFTQQHKDYAAAIQFCLEEIVFHIIKYYSEATDLHNLILVGGVAHNCTCNGKVLQSGLFDNVYVEPASHDAGTAIGAALHEYVKANGIERPEIPSHLYWGTDIGSNEVIEKELKPWSKFITYKKVNNVEAYTAKLINDQNVIGWVQSRSEFGPRALGNRSIVADPRPAENKKIINKMIKKREGYRPFAPSVLQDQVHEYFTVPHDRDEYSHMLYVVPVREKYRDLLGAVTHVDGTARIQTVNKVDNLRYWNLINEFYKLSGVPILLNTSFNNNAEPIVDSIYDAVVCYLTTDLNFLVVGDYVVQKNNDFNQAILSSIINLTSYSELNIKSKLIDGVVSEEAWIVNKHDIKDSHKVGHEISILLSKNNGRVSLGDFLSCELDVVKGGDTTSIVDEIIQLWQKRLITVMPSCE